MNSLKLPKGQYNAQFRWSTSYQLNCFIHLLIISAIFKEFMPHLTHKCYIFFQFAGDMPNSHMYKFPQNNLYSYNKIAHNLRKIHISGNGERNNCSKIDIYTKV